MKLLAVPTVSIAFQMGIEAAKASGILHEQRDELQSWSLLVPDMTENEALSALQYDDASDHTHLSQQCFVGAVWLSAVTISGPPPALNHFAEKLRGLQPLKTMIWLPIFAGYHAPHIHKMLDFYSFLSKCIIGDNILTSVNPAKKFLSPLTGEPTESASALDLFKAAVLHTLQAPLRFDRIVDYCVRLINENECPVSAVNIEIIEQSPVAEGLATTLRSRSSASISIRDLVADNPKANESLPRTPSNQEPLAIVGISGRFPGADSVEAFWGILEAGLDLHREVRKTRLSFRTKTSFSPSADSQGSVQCRHAC